MRVLLVHPGALPMPEEAEVMRTRRSEEVTGANTPGCTAMDPAGLPGTAVGQ